MKSTAPLFSSVGPSSAGHEHHALDAGDLLAGVTRVRDHDELLRRPAVEDPLTTGEGDAFAEVFGDVVAVLELVGLEQAAAEERLVRRVGRRHLDDDLLVGCALGDRGDLVDTGGRQRPRRVQRRVSGALEVGDRDRRAIVPDCGVGQLVGDAEDRLPGAFLTAVRRLGDVVRCVRGVRRLGRIRCVGRLGPRSLVSRRIRRRRRCHRLRR